MKSLITRAMEANDRLKKEIMEKFIHHLRWEIEGIIGTTEYTVIERQRFVLIIAEDIVLQALPNEEGEPKLSLIKKCQKCGDLFGIQLDMNHLTMLGKAIKEEAFCDCGNTEPIKLLGTENAESDMETWLKTSDEREAKREKIPNKVCR